MDIGRLGVWYFTDRTSAATAADWARKVESLGFNALWIPETTGRDSMAQAAWLLANTEQLIIATGIANIYHRTPGTTLQAQNTLAEQSNGRFLLGLGVSHKPLVEGVRGLRYGAPVTTMRKYLKNMDDSPYSGPNPDPKPPRVLAALGPKMLELAREKAQGAHPYFTSPQHTRMAREILGPEKWLCVEQKVIFSEDADTARDLARTVARMYIDLPNYHKNWLRMGMTESDLKKNCSDRFVDATFAWGSLDEICRRIEEHFNAGADHVCVQPFIPQGEMGQLPLEALAELAKSCQL